MYFWKCLLARTALTPRWDLNPLFISFLSAAIYVTCPYVCMCVCATKIFTLEKVEWLIITTILAKASDSCVHQINVTALGIQKYVIELATLHFRLGLKALWLIYYPVKLGRGGGRGGCKQLKACLIIHSSCIVWVWPL